MADLAVADEQITVVPEITSADDLPMLSWRRRMYWANIPPQYHACLAFMMDVNPRTLPAKITGKASITSDHYIMASGVKTNGDPFLGGFIGDVGHFADQMRWAADKSRLNVEERAALNAMLNDWIGMNYGGYTFEV